MIHSFNPGHETAVLNASKHYQPAANQLKMQRELAFLPAWYAQPDDFICIETPFDEVFQNEVRSFNEVAKPLLINELEENRTQLSNQVVELWGLSPASIHRFEQLSEHYQLHWQIPEWKDVFRRLGSRFAAHDVLAHLIRKIPAIDKSLLPDWLVTIEEIETYLERHLEKSLLKSPYSSSGRGLLWLSPGKLPRSEQQIISGILKKQSHVSIEKALDKQLDFSLHFVIDPKRQTQFTGYSVFQTNEKGAYKKSLLADQETLEKQITTYIPIDLLLQVKSELRDEIQTFYAPHYTGNIGVDMLIYRSDKRYGLDPCVEINMRKSMGFLAIMLHNQYIHPQSKGEFQIDHHSLPGEILTKHQHFRKQHPLVIENNRMVSGYLNLCPVEKTSAYHAYLLIFPPLSPSLSIHPVCRESFS